MPIDQAFIGSCTNGRYSDLLEASRVLRGSQIKVPLLISPGSAEVARQAEATGWSIFSSKRGPHGRAADARFVLV